MSSPELHLMRDARFSAALGVLAVGAGVAVLAALAFAHADLSAAIVAAAK